MEILAWNADKQRLAAMDVEFSKENTINGCEKAVQNRR